MPKKKAAPKIRKPKKKSEAKATEPKKSVAKKAVPKTKHMPVIDEPELSDVGEPVVEEPEEEIEVEIVIDEEIEEKPAPVVEPAPLNRATVVLSGCAKLVKHNRTFIKGVPFVVEGRAAINFYKNDTRFDVTEM